MIIYTLFMFIVIACSCSSQVLKTKLDGELCQVLLILQTKKRKNLGKHLNDSRVEYLEESHNIKISPLCFRNMAYDPSHVSPGIRVGVSGIQAALVDLDIIEVSGFKMGQKIAPHQEIDILLKNFSWHFRKTHNILSKHNVVDRIIRGWTNGYEKTREEDRLQKYEKKAGDGCLVSSCSESVDITIIGFTYDKKFALVELDANMIFRGGSPGCVTPCYFNKIFFLEIDQLVMARNCYFIQ